MQKYTVFKRVTKPLNRPLLFSYISGPFNSYLCIAHICIWLLELFSAFVALFKVYQFNIKSSSFSSLPVDLSALFNKVGFAFKKRKKGVIHQAVAKFRITASKVTESGIIRLYLASGLRGSNTAKRL